MWNTIAMDRAARAVRHVTESAGSMPDRVVGVHVCTCGVCAHVHQLTTQLPAYLAGLPNQPYLTNPPTATATWQPPTATATWHPE